MKMIFGFAIAALALLPAAHADDSFAQAELLLKQMSAQTAQPDAQAVAPSSVQADANSLSLEDKVKLVSTNSGVTQAQADALLEAAKDPQAYLNSLPADQRKAIEDKAAAIKEGRVPASN